MAALFEILIEQYPVLPYVRRERLTASRDNYYVFDDGRRLRLGYAPAWCPRCRAFAPAEALDTPAEIDERVAEYERGDLSVDRDRTLAELAFRREWVLARQSPPRCLRCFASDAVLLPHARRVRHPDGGPAWVTATMIGFAVPKRSGEWILTPEGLPRPEACVDLPASQANEGPTRRGAE
jgi:hypothetical protein